MLSVPEVRTIVPVPRVETMSHALKLAISRALGAALAAGAPIRVVVDRDDETSCPYGIEATYEEPAREVVCICHPCGYVE